MKMTVVTLKSNKKGWADKKKQKEVFDDDNNHDVLMTATQAEGNNKKGRFNLALA